MSNYIDAINGKHTDGSEHRELDLYAEDFDRESIWNAVCGAVGIDGFTANHIVINYNFATAVNVVDHKEVYGE